MKLNELLRLLTIADLKNLAVGDLTKTENREAVIAWVNQGILELYKIFNIVTKTHEIVLDGFNVDYDLPSDCMQILGAYEINGERIDINNEENERSIFTPTYNKVEIPLNYAETAVTIVYKSYPTTVIHDNDEIPIPGYMNKPLHNFVSYEAHKTMVGDDRLENESHYRKYSRSISEILQAGITPEDNTRENKFSLRGFI